MRTDHENPLGTSVPEGASGGRGWGLTPLPAPAPTPPPFPDTTGGSAAALRALPDGTGPLRGATEPSQHGHSSPRPCQFLRLGDTPQEATSPRGQSRPSPGQRHWLQRGLPHRAAPVPSCSPHGWGGGHGRRHPSAPSRPRSATATPSLLTSHAGSHDPRRPCRPPHLPAHRRPLSKWRKV